MQVEWKYAISRKCIVDIILIVARDHGEQEQVPNLFLGFVTWKENEVLGRQVTVTMQDSGSE